MASFQIKDFVSITASLLNRVRTTCAQLTDFNVGSKTRTLLEAVAQETDELYQQMVNGLVQGIETSVYTSFSFPLLPATAAGGLVRVVVTAPNAPVLIAAGSLVTPDSGSVTYRSSADVTIAAGATFVDVPVACTTTGAAGNLAAGTGFTLDSPPVGFVSASNLVAFSNGRDVETPAARKGRFQAYIRTLSRGTVAAVAYGAGTATVTDSAGNVIETAQLVLVDEPYTRDQTQPPGLVAVYLHNGVGGTSAALVANAQQIVNGYTDASGAKVAGYKAAGIPAPIVAATEQPLAVPAVLTAAANYDHGTVAGQVAQTLAAYILSLPIQDGAGDGTFIAARATELAMEVTGVANFVTTATDLSPAIGTKLMPGAVTPN